METTFEYLENDQCINYKVYSSIIHVYISSNVFLTFILSSQVPKKNVQLCLNVKKYNSNISETK